MAIKVRGVTTVVARQKLCKAHAGDIALPAITHMAWGDGGVDETGEPKGTTGDEIGLYHELVRKPIESHTYKDNELTCGYKSILEKGEQTGAKISEVGLYDADGDLIAYRTMLQKGKDEDIPQIYIMNEIF